MATKRSITLATLLSAIAVSANTLPAYVTTSAPAATVTVTVATSILSNTVSSITPLTTYDSSQIMSLYSSMTSSVDDEAATAYAAIAMSVESQHSVYSWYADWWVSRNGAAPTALSTVYVTTS